MKNSKFAALGLSVVLTLGLVACGSQTQEPKEDQQGGSGSVTTSPAPAESAPSSGNSVTDDFLKTITAETADAKGVCGADLTWYYQDGVLVIKGTGEMTNYTSDNKRPWHELEIGWVIIQEGVTSIGELAFSECHTLSKVELPETLEEIGESAFVSCYELSNITIPASVSYIGGSAFMHCKEPLSITFLGDAPELEPNAQIFEEWALTVYYSGSGFDEWQEFDSRITLIKQ